MSITTYFRQAWRQMLANKLFSAIYISGTALAIATTTLFAVIYYVKIAPIYPETNRMETYYFRSVQNSIHSTGQMMQSRLGYNLVRDHLYKLKNAEHVSATYDEWMPENYAQHPETLQDIKISTRKTDPAYFEIYPYRFIEGGPFTEDDLSAGTPVAVITGETALRMFGSETGVVGKTLKINFCDFRIVGVIESGSSLLSDSYAEVIMPYTTDRNYDKDRATFIGSMVVTMTSSDGDALREEINEIARKFNSSQTDEEVDFFDFPKSHMATAINPDRVDDDETWRNILRQNLLVLLVLLVVPALNLSGLISSRMEMRSSELGVRRSFGATKPRLLGQVLWENLSLTLAGGVVGLLIVWFSLWATSGSLLTIMNEEVDSVATSSALTSGILFAPAVFATVFLLCVVLNLLSALIPAWFSIRKQITNCLK